MKAISEWPLENRWLNFSEDNISQLKSKVKRLAKSRSPRGLEEWTTTRFTPSDGALFFQ